MNSQAILGKSCTTSHTKLAKESPFFLFIDIFRSVLGNMHGDHGHQITFLKEIFLSVLSTMLTMITDHGHRVTFLKDFFKYLLTMITSLTMVTKLLKKIFYHSVFCTIFWFCPKYHADHDHLIDHGHQVTFQKLFFDSVISAMLTMITSLTMVTK